jgi:hypothetical protein
MGVQAVLIDARQAGRQVAPVIPRGAGVAELERHLTGRLPAQIVAWSLAPLALCLALLVVLLARRVGLVCSGFETHNNGAGMDDRFPIGQQLGSRSSERLFGRIGSCLVLSEGLLAGAPKNY